MINIGILLKILKKFIIIVVLDPWYKFEYVSFWLENLNDVVEVEKVMAKIKESFIEFYEHYCNLDSMSSDFTHATLLSDVSLSSEVVVKK